MSQYHVRAYFFKEKFGRIAHERACGGGPARPTLAPAWYLVRLRSFPCYTGSAESSGSNLYLLSYFCALHPPLVNDEVRACLHQAGRDADLSHLLAPRAASWSSKGTGNQGNEQQMRGEALRDGCGQPKASEGRDGEKLPQWQCPPQEDRAGDVWHLAPLQINATDSRRRSLRIS